MAPAVWRPPLLEPRLITSKTKFRSALKPPMKIWDISRTLSNDLAEWPGDEPFRYRLTNEIAKGGSVNLGAITLSVHNGTHADARFHFDTNAESIEKVPLDTYLGRATVVDLSQTFSQSSEKHLITREDLRPHAEQIAATSRL